MGISKAWTAVKTIAAQHSPAILLGVGITGMTTAAVLAVRATPEALRRIEAYKKNHKHKKLTVWQTIQATWKCYIPAGITGVVSAGCLIGGNQISNKRTAALATAYSLSESALKEYQEKVVETVGEKKEQAIRESIAKDRVRENPPPANVTNIISGNDDALCYDMVSNQYFRSSVNKIKKVENEINYRLRDEMFVSLNDFYYELGIPKLGTGDDVGWSIDKGYLEVFISYEKAPDDRYLDTPCIILNYSVVPEYRHC